MGNCWSDDVGHHRKMSLDECVSSAKTGDIVLFSGNGFFSDIVRMGSESEWSHVGIVIRKNPGVEPILFQSTQDQEPYDIQSRSYKRGPKVSFLRSSLQKYDGYKIAIRRLHTGAHGLAAAAARNKWADILWKFQMEVNHLPYEQHVEELAASAFGMNETNDRTSYFCTELVADSMVKMGLIDDVEGSPVNSYTMDNFTSKYPIILKGGAFYEEEIYLTVS